MSTARIPVVLLGLGNMGRNHLRVITADTRFELVAVMDPMVTELPAGLPYNPPLVKSLKDILRFNFSAAVVATPTQTHFEIVEALLQADKHVLVEKPAASTFSQSVALRDLAAKRNLVLCVGNIERCNPAVSKLQEVVQSGLIGTPVHCNATRAGRFPGEVKPGNHVILDLAVHELDVLRMVLGPLKVLHSVCHSTRLNDIYDTAEILLQSHHGISGSVHVNWLSPQRIRNMRVTGSHGVCEIDYIQQACTVYGQDLKSRRPASFADVAVTRDDFCERMVFPVTKAESLKIQLGEFHGALARQPHRLCQGDQLTESVWLAEECVAKSIAGGFSPEVFAAVPALTHV